MVFPFENLGAPEDEYFSAGVTEEIIGRLASVRDLSVISRSSAFQYDKTGKTLQQIGEDFDVEYVLEGTVRWARERRDLIGFASHPNWCASPTTPASGPRPTIPPWTTSSRSRATSRGRSSRHWAWFSWGPSAHHSSPGRPRTRKRTGHTCEASTPSTKNPTGPLAEQMFQRAIELDPGFALAWAGLSRAHSWRFHGGDRTPERREAARSAAEEALRLAPEAPEAHMAMGLYYYRCFRDYDRALAEIAIAAAARPNDTDVLSWKATIYKRQGNFEESIRLNQRVLELDPMDDSSANETRRHLSTGGRLPEGHRGLRSCRLPSTRTYRPLTIRKALIYFTWKGTTTEARAAMEAMPVDGEVGLAEPRLVLARVLRRPYSEERSRAPSRDRRCSPIN